jgi:class 3 adenylate cyclase
MPTNVGLISSFGGATVSEQSTGGLSTFLWNVEQATRAWKATVAAIEAKLQAPGSRYFLFADQVGSSTAPNDAEGLARTFVHNAIIGNTVAANAGQLVKFVGDEAMVKFDTADRAIACAKAILVALREFNDGVRIAGPRVQTRIGVHGGSNSLEDEDRSIQQAFAPGDQWQPLPFEFFGPDIVLAKRLVELAGPDEILASDATIRDNVAPPQLTGFVQLTFDAHVKGAPEDLAMWSYRPDLLPGAAPGSEPSDRDEPHPLSTAVKMTFGWWQSAQAIKACHEELRRFGEKHASLDEGLPAYFRKPRPTAADDHALMGSFNAFVEACSPMVQALDRVSESLNKVHTQPGTDEAAVKARVARTCSERAASIRTLMRSNQVPQRSECDIALGKWPRDAFRTLSTNLDNDLKRVALDLGALWEKART